ncbi:hypothetical protein QQ008_02550 [Fulvivirgaceae bacterium BMA10]|uniref:Uncharacterized protein n=1 Tax=Splendidivirga corallicola TaxID=3051826 RepID=A0ABT8KHM5_9BACT|nr:hypothetical protein [Fulvivirgaceae bacterium BMA10]
MIPFNAKPSNTAFLDPMNLAKLMIRTSRYRYKSVNPKQQVHGEKTNQDDVIGQ